TREWFDRLRDLALGLGAVGVGAGDRIAIVSESRPEWLLCDLAGQTIGAVSVPVYSTLSPAQSRYILQDAGVRLAFVSTAEQLEKLQSIRHQLPSLEIIVSFDSRPDLPSPPLSDPLAPLSAPPGSVMTLDALVERGHARMMAGWGLAREFRDRARTVRPEDLATIIY